MTKQERMSQKTRFDVMKFLEANIGPDPDYPEYVMYENGASDLKVAGQFNINVATVRRMRQEIFGELRRGGITSNLPLARLADLEKRVEDLERKLRVRDYHESTNGAHHAPHVSR